MPQNRAKAQKRAKTMQLTKTDLQTIKDRSKAGEQQIDIAKDYRDRGYVSFSGKPIMGYTISAIVNKARFKAAYKRRYALKQVELVTSPVARRKYTRRVASTVASGSGLEDFMLTTIADKGLSNSQKIKVLQTLLGDV